MIFSSLASIFFKLIKILSGFTSFFWIFVKFPKFYKKIFFRNIVKSAFHNTVFWEIAFFLFKINVLISIVGSEFQSNTASILDFKQISIKMLFW